MDLIYLSVICVFFALSWALLKLCESLMGS